MSTRRVAPATLIVSLVLAACGTTETPSGGGDTVGAVDTSGSDITFVDSGGGGVDAVTGDTATGDTAETDTQVADTQTADTQASDTQTADTQASDTQTADTQASDTQTADTQASDTQTADTQTADTTSTDSASSDSADGAGGDATTTDGTSGDAQGGDAGDATSGDTASGASCKDQCGKELPATAGCQCDPDCVAEGDCCADWKPLCGCKEAKDCDDGDACTTDTCDAKTGACTNAAKVCDDKNPCTSDACDKAKGCTTTPNAAACDDGDPCTEGDACKDAKCGGVAKTCDDKDPCTVDACDAKSGKCTTTPAKDGGACDDANPCTDKDACKGGKCGGVAKGCDDGNPCTKDQCNGTTGACEQVLVAAGTKCDDGNACTSGDACQGGKCTGKGKDCDDGNPCTVDTCDPKTTKCSHGPAKDGAPCTDFNPCTSSDACKAGTCVGAAKTCDDGNPCTVDSCDTKDGTCKTAPGKDGLTCDDGDACTPKSACAKGKCTGAPISCDDGQACTADTCDSKTGKCSNTAILEGKGCDDGDACTDKDVCNQGVCAGVTKACADGKACTADSCDSKTGKCAHKALADGAPCQDGNGCTEGDTCKAGQCTAGKDVCKLTQVWKDDIDCKTANWVYEPLAAEPAVAWHVDDTPSEPKAKTGTCTLNFNNGKDYAIAGKPSVGQATSVTIKVPQADFVELRFWHYYDTETGSSYDKLLVDVSADGFQKGVQSVAMTKSSAAKGKWAEVKLNLSQWAGQQIRLRFRFDSHDHISNTGKGWFIDDISLWAGAKPASCSGSCGVSSPLLSCQCSAACEKAGNCCADYKAVCTGCKADADCDDGETCTIDACDAKTGACSNKAKAPGTACDDGDICTVKDACTAGRCGGAKRDCDDGKPCTWDTCDSDKGCQHAAAGASTPCDDGKVCTLKDACKNGVCTGGTPKCDDGKPCTTDACDAKTGACSAKVVADGTVCSDGKVCTTGDRCIGGACLAGTPKCDDGNSCTNDACEAATGKCTNTPKADGTLCTDGEVCTTGDVCTKGTCAGVASCTFAPIYTNPVDCASESSWTFAPAAKEPATAWHVDATPDKVKPKTGTCTLNFNNGKDYVTQGGKAYGVATLKAGIQLPATGDARLRFASHHASEANNSYDKRFVEISTDGFKTVAITTKLDNSKGKDTWTDIVVPLDKLLGKKVWVRFIFDSVDGFANDTAGWFIDDLVVEGGKPGAVTCKDAKACNDGNPCTADACSGGSCKWTPAKDGTACGDGDACIDKGACKAGKCAGGAAVCNDGKPCTTDACVSGKGCVFTAKIDGAACDDGDVCTTKDACSSGSCKGAGKCDDGNSCTIDQCDAKSGKCTSKLASDGVQCNDGDLCSEGDVCSKGSCGGKPKDCDDGNSCTVDTCSKGTCGHASAKDGTSCTDGNACTLGDVCAKGVCGGKDACSYTKLIDDTLPCDKNDGWVMAPSVKEPKVGWQIDATPATPAPKSGKCSLNFNNGKDFADGSLAVLGTVTSKAVTLPQSGHARLRFWSWHGVETNNSYDKRTVQISADGFKSDAEVITLSNSKDKAKAWMQHEVVLGAWLGKKIQVRFGFDSVDGVQNTGAGWFIDDVLVEVGTGAAAQSCQGRCGLFVQGAKCQCNDTCAKSGDCCQDYAQVCTGCTGASDCDDGNPCTTDTCDTKTGACKNTVAKDGAACDDGSQCMTDGKCSGGKCSGKAKVCSDGKPCTFDSCKPGEGCVHPFNSAPCDDGNPCTGSDTCSNGSCKGAAKPCDDGKSCTNDSCDSKTGKCAFVPKADGAFCTDGKNCTTPDTCVKGACVGKPKDCDDGDACTVDTCDEKAGCTHKPAADGTACNDGDACTLTSSCKAGQCVGVDSCKSTTVMSDSFPCDAKGKWAFAPLSTGATPTFAIDATPVAVTPKSPKCSLNFNNGKSFVAPGAGRVQGSATSAPMTVPNAAGAELRFWSYHDTETSQSYDKRYVEISDDNFVANVQQVHLVNNQGIKTWALKTVDLGAWQGKTVRVRFRFDSVDGIQNTGAGWFIDDMSVVSKAAKSACQKASDCGDGGPCADAICNAGLCALKANKADGTACNDGDACTEGDACAKGVCAGKAKVCDDKNPCTWDTCSPTTGACTAVQASDGTVCGGGKVCDKGACKAP